ncbi:MAG: RDD family protein [Acidobacteriota bacterium]|nr:RDD family protein [Acidobacteriota bacterium]
MQLPSLRRDRAIERDSADRALGVLRPGKGRWSKVEAGPPKRLRFGVLVTPHFHTLRRACDCIVCCERAMMLAFLTGTSAAQNGPVIRICPKCGALLLDDTDSCSFCSAEASEKTVFLESALIGQAIGASARSSDSSAARSTHAVAVSRSSGAAAAAAPALAPAEPEEPDWRDEVSRRLEHYRARRGHLRHDDSQSGLPFSEPVANAAAEAEQREHAEAQARAELRDRAAQRQREHERVEIRIQPELDFSASPDDRAHPQTALVPVATLAERRWAAALDAIFLGFTCAGFLGLFRSLGGEITVGNADVAVYALAAYFFYGFYISLFTVIAGSTLGMQLRGLAVVRLDGSLPDTRQLVWRSFGYLLSGATVALGFIWALWDEDRFTWQDRISQTYITAAVPLTSFDSFAAHPAMHRWAHK